MSSKITALVWELSFEVASHKLVMLALADNSDSEGLCYPFVSRIAKYTGMTVRHIQKILTTLEQNKYISREDRYRRNRQQSSNCYQISIQKNHARIDHHSVKNTATFTASSRAQKLSTRVSQETPTPVLHDTPPPVLHDTPPPLKNDEKPSINNTLTETRAAVTKSSLTKNITKREKTLSIFEPNDENKQLCIDLKLNIIDEIQSFENRHKGERNQYEFSRWVKRSYEYLNKQKVVQLNETRCTVPEYGPGHPRWEMLHGNGSQAAGDNTRGTGVQKVEGYLF